MSKLIRLIKPGFLPTDPAGTFCRVDEHGHCSTCSDEALPAHVLRVSDEEGIALAEMDGREMEIEISLVDDVQPGTWLLVHGGVALERLTEVEA
jgi:hydrogenase assembly chaperone HypC/HupF